MSTIEKSIDVNVPVHTAYNQWTQFKEFPRFMEGVREVRQLDDKHLHWCATVGGKEKEWDAEIVEQVPDQRIAWRNTTGARNAGVVTFHRLAENTTRVRVQLDYEPEGVMENLGDFFGTLSRRVEGDLERFKGFIESRGQETGAWRGEIHDRAPAQPAAAAEVRQGAGQVRPGPAAEGEVRIPVVEEEMEVGKRTVKRGGVRARSRVTEQPVEESVQLRDERVTVERRPVDRPASAADVSALKERTVEVTETDEEAVVAKRARVVEEVAIGKEVEQRTETVRGTVRRTEVEVEQLGAAPGTGASGFETYDTDFRTHFTTAFSGKGYAYDRYAPAYRYGYDLAADPRYHGRDWAAVEAQARRDWEGRNQGAWEDVKDAIRYAWDKARGKVRTA